MPTSLLVLVESYGRLASASYRPLIVKFGVYRRLGESLRLDSEGHVINHRYLEFSGRLSVDCRYIEYIEFVFINVPDRKNIFENVNVDCITISGQTVSGLQISTLHVYLRAHNILNALLYTVIS